MSASRSTADRGLRAVARVRGVREHDSRVGLQMALVEQQSLEQRVEVVGERLASLPGDGARTPAELLTLLSGFTVTYSPGVPGGGVGGATWSKKPPFSS